MVLCMCIYSNQPFGVAPRLCEMPPGLLLILSRSYLILRVTVHVEPHRCRPSVASFPPPCFFLSPHNRQETDNRLRIINLSLLNEFHQINTCSRAFSSRQVRRTAFLILSRSVLGLTDELHMGLER